jgi:hypothetical protein
MINEIKDIKDLLVKLNDKIDAHFVCVEKALLSIMLMDLKNYCWKYLDDDKFSYVPSCIKRAIGASRLFNNKVWELHVESRKFPGEDWDSNLHTSSADTVFMYIISSDFRMCLSNDFSVDDISDPRRLSLNSLFTDDEKAYKIGDEILVMLYDTRLGSENPQCPQEFVILDIEYGGNFGASITIEGTLSTDQREKIFGLKSCQDNKYFYKAGVLYDKYRQNSDFLILHGDGY